MNRQDFEALFLDYEEGVVDPKSRELLEQAILDDITLSESFSRFKFIKKISSSIAREEYRASPGFRYKVLEAIEEPSSLISRIFKPAHSILLGAVTAATLVLALVLTRDSPSPIPDEVLVAELPVILRKTSPLLIAEFARSGERLNFTPGLSSNRTSAIENLINALDFSFPPGPQTPIGVSFEIIRSPRAYEQLLLRVSLSGVPQEGGTGYVAEDIKLDFEIESENIYSIEPLGSENEKIIITESGRLPMATGRRMLADQQFNSFSLIRIKNPNLDTYELLNIIVKYKDPSTELDTTETIIVDSKVIERDFSKVSPGMRQAFWSLFQDELNPGAFDKVKPEAVQTIKPFVEEMLNDILDPNPEKLENLKNRLESLRPTPRPIRIPRSLKDKFTKEQLDELYPNWVYE